MCLSYRPIGYTYVAIAIDPAIRAFRQLHSVNFGGDEPLVQKLASAARRGRRSYLNKMSETCFKISQFLHVLQNTYYIKKMHVQQLFFAVVWPQIREKRYYENSFSVTKGKNVN